MLEQEDSLVAFIETWGLVVRFHQYLQEGAGSSLFADNQHLYVEMTTQLVARIESIGKTFLDEDAFEETRKLINSFARSNPIKTLFSNHGIAVH